MQRRVEPSHHRPRLLALEGRVGGRRDGELGHLREGQVLADDVLLDHVEIAGEAVFLLPRDARRDGGVGVVSRLLAQLAQGVQPPPAGDELVRALPVPVHLDRLALAARADRRLQLVHLVGGGHVVEVEPVAGQVVGADRVEGQGGQHVPRVEGGAVGLGVGGIAAALLDLFLRGRADGLCRVADGDAHGAGLAGTAGGGVLGRLDPELVAAAHRSLSITSGLARQARSAVSFISA